MYKVNEIKELIRAVDKSGIGELEIRGENKEKLIIKKEGSVEASGQQEAPQAPVVSAPPAPPVKEEANQTAVKEEKTSASESQQTEEKKDETLQEITSPMVGTFYRAPSPDADPYVKEGDKIQEDTVVCIVEAMKLMNELEAEVSGEIVEILVENGELVEYGQPLFLVRP